MKKLIFILVFVLLFSVASAETFECWVLCQPDSCVNIRERPKKSSPAFGEAECCDKFYTDGKIINGCLHLFDFAGESDEAWIAKAYIVYDEPYKPKFEERQIISPSRVAARRTIGGKRRTWLHEGDLIKVYAISDEWCVTSQGFVKTEFIDTGSYMKEKYRSESSEMTYEDD